jgi:hypothetical protein
VIEKAKGLPCPIFLKNGHTHYFTEYYRSQSCDDSITKYEKIDAVLKEVNEYWKVVE